MVGIYLRLSKEDEHLLIEKDKKESNSIINQKTFILEKLKSMQNITLYNIYIDDGFTGLNFERPAFQTMMEDIKLGKINCIIVKDLSRFGRNYIESGRYIEKIFPYLGVRFIAINDNIDTLKLKNNTVDEIIIPFKNLINDAYSRDISIKIRSNLDIKRKNGEFIGSFAPYGYKKARDNKNQLIVDEKAAFIIKDIFQWKIEGISSLHIADKLNKLGISTPMQYKIDNGENYYCGFYTKANPKWDIHNVNYILRNSTYIGILTQGKTTAPSYKIRKRIKKEEKDFIRCKDTHTPIISKEEFAIVQKLLNEDTRVAPKENTLHLFSGIAKCSYCKKNMTRKTIPYGKKKYIYLVCCENKVNKTCKNNKYFSLKKFESMILKTINFYIKEIIDMEKILQFRNFLSYKKYKIEKIKEEIQEKIQKSQKIEFYSLGLYKDYKENLIRKQEYNDLKEYYKFRINEISYNIDNLKKEKQALESKEQFRIGWIEYFIKNKEFKILTRQLLLFLIEEIYIYDKNKIQIIFRFNQK